LREGLKVGELCAVAALGECSSFLLGSFPISDDIEIPPPCRGPKPGKSRPPAKGVADGGPRGAPKDAEGFEDGDGGGILRAAKDGGGGGGSR